MDGVKVVQITLYCVEASLGVADALDSSDAGAIQAPNRAQAGIDAGRPVLACKSACLSLLPSEYHFVQMLFGILPSH